MKGTLFFLIINILFPQNNSSTEQDILNLYGGKNPCDDEIFTLMKDKGINGLTDREYDYYKIQSTKCDEYRKSILGSENKKIDEISTPTQDNNTNLGLTDKKALYLAGRKDPGSAGFFHFLLPSTGHAYVGDWGKGVPLLATGT